MSELLDHSDYVDVVAAELHGSLVACILEGNDDRSHTDIILDEAAALSLQGVAGPQLLASAQRRVFDYMAQVDEFIEG